MREGFPTLEDRLALLIRAQPKSLFKVVTSKTHLLHSEDVGYIPTPFYMNSNQFLCQSGVFQERLQTMRHRLQLSSQLYRNPDRPEDVATVIIEQVSRLKSVTRNRRLSCLWGVANSGFNLQQF